MFEVCAIVVRHMIIQNLVTRQRALHTDDESQVGEKRELLREYDNMLAYKICHIAEMHAC